MRGTQSFVGVMAEVWKRPSLTAIEVLWRWSFVELLLVGIFAGYGRSVWQYWSDFPTTAQVALHDGFIIAFEPGKVWGAFLVLLTLSVVWAAFCAAGRRAMLRRIDFSLHGRWAVLWALAVLRVLLFLGVVAVWCWGCAPAVETFVSGPLAQHFDVGFLPQFALAVFVTLLLFVGWSLVSWVMQLAPVLAMARGLGAVESIRAALRAGPLRGKLIEINLVMGIVKVALLVLAMVFSACPLPFSNVETQAFLTWWWAGVGVWYLLASDYFHTVRTAAYFRLWQAYQEPEPDGL